MLKVKWTEPALDDMDALVAYIHENNPPAAKKVAETLWQAGRRLGDMPEMGKPGRYPGTREWVVGGVPYILWYSVQSVHIDILRVIHTSRQWPEQP